MLTFNRRDLCPALQGTPASPKASAKPIGFGLVGCRFRRKRRVAHINSA